jgi:hypothetical protein
VRVDYYILESVTPAKNDKNTAFYPFVIPAVNCPACENTWISHVPIPQICPIEFRSRLLQGRTKPLVLSEHRDLVLDITSSLGISFPELRPGNCLMPSLSPMPEQSAEFIWTWLPTTIFVSDQIKMAFEAQSFRGLTFFKPFHYRTDEERAELESKLCSAQDLRSSSPFWEMSFPNLANFADLGVKHSDCQECRRGDLKAIPKEHVIHLVDRFDMVRVRGLNEVVVSERVKQFIDREHFTNVKCSRSFLP